MNKEYNLAKDDCIFMCELSLNFYLFKQASFCRSKIRVGKPAALKYRCVASCGIYVGAANLLQLRKSSDMVIVSLSDEENLNVTRPKLQFTNI